MKPSFAKNIKLCYWNKSATKLDLFHSLALLCDLPLGINENQLSDKAWLINCLYTKNSDHGLFKKISETVLKRELPEGTFVNLAVPFKTAKRRSFFGMTEKEKKKKMESKAKLLHKKAKRQKYLESQVAGLKGQHTQLEGEIIRLKESIFKKTGEAMQVENKKSGRSQFEPRS